MCEVILQDLGSAPLVTVKGTQIVVAFQVISSFLLMCGNSFGHGPTSSNTNLYHFTK